MRRGSVLGCVLGVLALVALLAGPLMPMGVAQEPPPPDIEAPFAPETPTSPPEVPPANTPLGDNVVVIPTGNTGTTVSFGTVTATGDTTVTATSTAPALPDGFLQLGATFYDVTTTATFGGLATICFPYDPTGVADPNALALLHYENGAWVDVTVSNDVFAGQICGRVSSFSPFAVVPQNLAPILTVPSAPIVVEATSNAGAAVPFSATAIDDADPNPTVACTAGVLQVVSGATFAVGTNTVSCTAGDATGNTSEAQAFIVRVEVTMSGFASPIDGGGVLNGIKAGRTVPIKFTAGALTDPGKVRVTVARLSSCGTGATVEAVPTADLTTGNTTLRYDAESGRFVYNWSTKNLVVGACYRVAATAIDAAGNSVAAAAGPAPVADFKLST